jgi:hypothetical protein
MADKNKSHDEIPASLVDKRLVERQIASGKLSHADFEKHISGLADAADKADNIASVVYPSNNT